MEENADAGTNSAADRTEVFQRPAVDNLAETEISVMDVARAIWRYKLLVVGITTSSIILALVVAFSMTPIYRSEVLMAPVSFNEQQNSLAGLANQFGGLATLVGLPGSIGDDVAATVATLKSRSFTGAFIREQNLLPILFAADWDSESGKWKNKSESAPTINDAVSLFDHSVRRVLEDAKTGLVRVIIDWEDPELAAQWANSLVLRINQQMRQDDIDEARNSIAYLEDQLTRTSVANLEQVIYGLIEGHLRSITLAQVRDEYAFKIIDPAAPSDLDDEIRPNKILIMLSGFMIGFGIACFVALVKHIPTRITQRSREDV